MTKLRVAVICGGPSEERGISLNSARSLLDHLQAPDVAVATYFLDRSLRAFAIPTAQMYSNTPSDFDFKLASTAQAFASPAEFLAHLSATADIVFPALHGKFGEDGGIQALLESRGLPFVGTSAAAASTAFDKYAAAAELASRGFATLPSFLFQGLHDGEELHGWFEAQSLSLATGRVVVKPARAGSSIGVAVALGVEEAIAKAALLIEQGVDTRVVVERFAEGGREFTAIVLDSEHGPVTLLPTEVELRAADGGEPAEEGRGIFNYRRKYLPTRQVSYHTPPRFSLAAVAAIRRGASRLFSSLGLRDFARVDGWLLPPPGRQGAAEGEETIVFSDINLVSGMEQTSFLFQQAALVGLSHAGVLRWVLRRACSRYGLLLAPQPPEAPGPAPPAASNRPQARPRVWVLFGGATSERQVSLMSGTNVWLKLRSWPELDVEPFLLSPSNGYASGSDDSDGVGGMDAYGVWALPYASVLRHTVEEVVEGCLGAQNAEVAARLAQCREDVMSELQGAATSAGATDRAGSGTRAGAALAEQTPRQVSLRQWLRDAATEGATVFLAVHGGIGEDGTLQATLEAARIPFTGSGAEASRLCMDKVATAAALGHLRSQGVMTAAKTVVHVGDMLSQGVVSSGRAAPGEPRLGDSAAGASEPAEAYWRRVTRELGAPSLCVKPASDGCSTGVAKLSSAADLSAYVAAVHDGAPRLLPGTLSTLKSGVVEMPVPPPARLLLEPFIETDAITSDPVSLELRWAGASRWVEVTVAVLGRRGAARALTPSITVKETGDVLSLEEKFQGGTGINLTPPPANIVSPEALEGGKRRIELVAQALGIEGFARIDAFLHADSGEIIVIEANTVPGMTPSTVLFHQALAEEPPIYPRDFFRRVVNLAESRYT